MTRHEFTRGQTHIAYGTEELAGYFLTVRDLRLEWTDEASEETNAVCETISIQGTGSYFHLYTGLNGYGQRVTVACMTVFMERYGVPESHIKLVKERKECEQNGDY
jgi:hypothetical protein